MRARFLHLADVHLGTYHWGSRERARDYGRALRWVTEYAADTTLGPGEPVGFVLIAGDLFDRAGIDAATHDEAHDALRTLQRAHIPVVVTEGNHDRPKDREHKSWLESFADRGYFAYLDAGFSARETPGGTREMMCTLAPFDHERMAGSYVDLAGIRIVGMRYVGHSLRRCVDAMARALDGLPTPAARTILAVHGGVEGIIPGYKAEVTRDQLAVLEPRLDYLALGHIHKRFTNRDLDDPLGTHGATLREWVFNPGSLQLWRRDEAPWRHGFYDVLLDDALPRGLEARFVEAPDRPCAAMHLDVGDCASPEDLLAAARRIVEERRDTLGAGERPLAFLVLGGRLRFDRRELDLGALDTLLRDVFDPVARDVADRTVLTEADVRLGSGWDGPIDQAGLEREIYRQLWLADERDRPHADALADLTQQVKGMVLEAIAPGEVLDHLLASYRALRKESHNGTA